MFGLMSKKRFVFAFAVLVFAGTVSLQADEKKSDDPPLKENFGRESRLILKAFNRDPDAPLTEREKIHHVLSRFSFGATPELMAEVEKVGLDKWFAAQLKGEVNESDALKRRVRKLNTLGMTNRELVDDYQPVFPKELSLQNKLTSEQLKERSRLLNLRHVPKDHLKDFVLFAAIEGNHQLKETATDFWRNHFNIEATKGVVRYYATSYERDVLRAEALGTFRAMLNKEARHPAMLVYLDNYISRSIPPKQLEAAARKEFLKTRDYEKAMQAVDIAIMRGLNENYARELMELHTLGVDNHYQQKDVVAVAEALTGWTITKEKGKPIEFEFRKDMHTPANRTFLRARIPGNPQRPEAEGQRILDLLANHPSTAKFISYKLCRHFVNDSPHSGMVNRVARAFSRGRKTDLPTTYRAIYKDPEFFNPDNYQTKFKRPFEFIVSAMRVTGAEIESTKGLHSALLVLNEPIYECIDPTGYYDQADVWSDPGTISARWQVGLQIALGKMQGVSIPDSFWDGIDVKDKQKLKEGLINKVLPMGVSQQTSDGLDTVIKIYANDFRKTEPLKNYLLGALLGSPEFQRQ